MHARVVRAKVKSGQLDDFLRMFQDEIVPQLKGEQGYQELLVTVDRAASDVLNVVVYTSEAALRAADAAFRQRVSKARQYLEADPEVSVREIAIRG